MSGNALAEKTALVTGGSKGIGFHLARMCAKAGADLILASRDNGALENAAAGISSEFGQVSVTRHRRGPQHAGWR